MTMHPQDAYQRLLVLAAKLPAGERKAEIVSLVTALRTFDRERESMIEQMTAAFFIQRATCGGTVAPA